MGTRAVVYWEGPGEYTPVLTARWGWFVWCRALDALVGITLNNASHAAMPEPSWADAPPWAMWTAVGPSTRRYWAADELVLDVDQYDGRWMSYEGTVDSVPCDLPLGVDWRQTLQRRPEASECLAT